MPNGVSYEHAFSTICDAIRELLADRGKAPDTIEADTPLFAYEAGVESPLDLDSMDALDLIALIEDRLEVAVPEDIDYESLRTVSDLARLAAS